MEEIIISEEKANFYGELVEKWSRHRFENKEEEQEFILLLKKLLDENDDEVEFEARIDIANMLTGTVYLKKFRPEL